MTMRDKIAVLLQDSYENDQTFEDAADTLLAALPGMVPELVWEQPLGGFHRAPTIGGKVEIMWDTSPHDKDHYVLFPGTKQSQVFMTLPAAKAAANAHHQAAVCKAMGWTP